MNYLAEMQQWNCDITLDPSSDRRGSFGTEISHSDVPLDILRATYSPRLYGEDPEHVQRIAELDTPVPPIVVHRPTMRVIDGMHRVRAARLLGLTTIAAVFFDGSEAEAFALAVKLNISHGLPLTHAERLAAAERILASHPQRSDRAIGACTGLAAKTVAAIRQRAIGDIDQGEARIGRDGKTRPVDGSRGRLLATELIKSSPHASLREIARAAGVSPTTVRDVRARLERGEDPVPRRRRKPAQPALGKHHENLSASLRLLDRLRRDPSMRHTEAGRALLRLLNLQAVTATERQKMILNLPAHRREAVAMLALEYAVNWQQFASELTDQ